MSEVEEALDRASKAISQVRDPAIDPWIKRTLIALHDAITALAGVQEPEEKSEDSEESSR